MPGDAAGKDGGRCAFASHADQSAPAFVGLLLTDVCFSNQFVACLFVCTSFQGCLI